MKLISMLYDLVEDMVLSKRDCEECVDHVDLTERIRKTLYYGITPGTERPSLPVTEIAVEFLQDAAPQTLGQVDSYLVSSIGKKASVSPCSLMLGMLYIERLKHRNPDYLQQVSSSDLFIIAMMVASKYLYDEGIEEEVFNEDWAESAKMDLEELNDLERTFLAAIDWSLFVKPEDFWEMLGSVEQRIALDKGLNRGFFTYTDLDVVSRDGHLFQMVKHVAQNMGKVVLVFSVAYIAGTLTLVAAPVALTLLKSALPLTRNIPSHSGELPAGPWHKTDIPRHSGPQSDHVGPHMELETDPELPLELELPVDSVLSDTGHFDDIRPLADLQPDNSILPLPPLQRPKLHPSAQKGKSRVKPHHRHLPHSKQPSRRDRVLISWLFLINPCTWTCRTNGETEDTDVLLPLLLHGNSMDSPAEKSKAPLCKRHSVGCHLKSGTETELKDMDMIGHYADLRSHCQNATTGSSSQNCVKGTKVEEGNRLRSKALRKCGHCSSSSHGCVLSCSTTDPDYPVENSQKWEFDDPVRYSIFADLALRLGIGSWAETAMAG